MTKKVVKSEGKRLSEKDTGSRNDRGRRIKHIRMKRSLTIDLRSRIHSKVVAMI